MSPFHVPLMDWNPHAFHHHGIACSDNILANSMIINVHERND